MGSALEKFLQRGGGAFHHLACGDAVDQLLVQRAYRAAFRARAHKQQYTTQGYPYSAPYAAQAR